jgi:hypothetical protein
MRAAVLAAMIALLPAAQESADLELRWSLDPNLAAEYSITDPKTGKPVPGRAATFLLFAADLSPDGTNSLIPNTFQELPLHLAMRLPPGKLKPGARAKIEVDLFEEAQRAWTAIMAFKPIAARGMQTFQKVEKMGERDCARVTNVIQFFDLRIDSRGRKDVGRSAIASMEAVAWFSVRDTIPIRVITNFSGRISEFRGIKQGEEPKSSKLTESLQYDLKKDFVKFDLGTHREPIHEAIRRGADWLKKEQQRNGTWVDSGGSFARDFPTGTTALALMALLHSGVKPDDPSARSALAWCQRADFRKVYEVAATIMAVETKYLPLEQYEEAVEMTEDRARKVIADNLTPEDRSFLERAVAWLLSKQMKNGTWGYPEQTEQFYDNSNTQYALLALKSAARCGIRIAPSVWRRIADHWLDTQKSTPGGEVELKLDWVSAADAGVDLREGEKSSPGAWGYFVRPRTEFADQVPDQGYGSMVCAGLTSLIIAESELFRTKDLTEDLRRRISRAQKAGLAWLQSRYSVRGCPPSAGFWSVFHLYYLYSLERVGVLYGIKRMDGHDWYLEGALLLVRDQRADGGWLSYDEIPVVDTAFALLFLKKATLKVATR